jgi:hypothetical protein
MQRTRIKHVQLLHCSLHPLAIVFTVRTHHLHLRPLNIHRAE